MSDIAISVRNVSKQYHIGAAQPEYRTFRDTLADAVAGPFRRAKQLFTGQTDSASGLSETIWALKDISFDVKKGEVVGIIGRNGAGKSTLLKILSRITTPTTGEVRYKGRLGSLLEVGTGFHQELTGRENIYLNGAILGMTRAEINRKFDEIVDFSGVEKFLDTPVKHYSSGMHVRLAFAVAAHLEPEILVVDEVLAVGDAQFQKKSMGKMSEVAGEGRTVLFVSHNMGAIAQLCGRAVLLNQGVVQKDNRSTDVIDYYMRQFVSRNRFDTTSIKGPLADVVRIDNIYVNGRDISEDAITVSPKETIEIRVQGRSATSIERYRTTLSIFHGETRLFTIYDSLETTKLPIGNFEAHFRVPDHLLRPGEYSIGLGGYRGTGAEWMWADNVAFFHVTEEWDEIYGEHDLGIINLPIVGSRHIFQQTNRHRHRV